MKIRVTFEIDDTDRVAVSVASRTGFKPASREQLENYITGAVDDKFNNLRNAFGLLLEGLELQESGSAVGPKEDEDA